MSSKKNKAAQAAASTAAKPAETAKADNTAKVTKTEKGNAETTQQVAAPAATEKPAAAQPKKEEKAQTQAKTDKQPAQKGAAQQSKLKKDKTPTVIAEEVDPAEAVKTLAKSIGAPTGSSTSSTDAKAMLSFVGHQRFTNNEELKKNFPEQYNAINQAINAVWFLGMLGVQQEMIGMQAEGKLQLIVSPEQIMPLQEMATMFGVKLASPRALPGATDGQLAIPFGPQETIIPEELKDPKLAKLEVPETDIEKVGSDHEKICSALEYLLRKDRNIVISLIDTIEWYRKLCINNASTTDEKLKIDNRRIDEWINEIFHLVPVAGLMKGIGRAVYLYTKKENSPVSAHCIVHGAVPTVTDDEVVLIVRTFIQENFRYNLEDKIDANGNVIKTEKIENPADDKAIQATMGVIGVDYVDKLMHDYTCSVPEGATDEQLAEIKIARDSARKVISLVRANYYPGKIPPTNEQLRFAVGKIINYYRSPMDKIAEFEGPLPVLVGEYPETKKEEAAAEEKKS